MLGAARGRLPLRGRGQPDKGAAAGHRGAVARGAAEGADGDLTVVRPRPSADSALRPLLRVGSFLGSFQQVARLGPRERPSVEVRGVRALARKGLAQGR